MATIQNEKFTLGIVNNDGSPRIGALVELKAGSFTYNLVELGFGKYQIQSVPTGKYIVWIDGINSGESVPVGAGQVSALGNELDSVLIGEADNWKLGTPNDLKLLLNLDKVTNFALPDPANQNGKVLGVVQNLYQLISNPAGGSLNFVDLGLHNWGSGENKAFSKETGVGEMLFPVGENSSFYQIQIIDESGAPEVIAEGMFLIQSQSGLSATESFIFSWSHKNGASYGTDWTLNVNTPNSNEFTISLESGQTINSIRVKLAYIGAEESDLKILALNGYTPVNPQKIETFGLWTQSQTGMWQKSLSDTKLADKVFIQTGSAFPDLCALGNWNTGEIHISGTSLNLGGMPNNDDLSNFNRPVYVYGMRADLSRSSANWTINLQAPLHIMTTGVGGLDPCVVGYNGAGTLSITNSGAPIFLKKFRLESNVSISGTPFYYEQVDLNGFTLTGAIKTDWDSQSGGAVDSVFGRTGVITSQFADYSLGLIGASPYQYITAIDGQGALDQVVDKTLFNEFGISTHIGDLNNPHLTQGANLTSQTPLYDGLNGDGTLRFKGFTAGPNIAITDTGSAYEIAGVGGSSGGSYAFYQIWGEESSALDPVTLNGFQWSFGNGATGQLGGVPIVAESEISTLAFNSKSAITSEATIEVLINNSSVTSIVIPNGSTSFSTAIVPVYVYSGDILTFRTTAGSGGSSNVVTAGFRQFVGGSASLDQLTDVNIGLPSGGDILIYNGTGSWLNVPSSILGGGIKAEVYFIETGLTSISGNVIITSSGGDANGNVGFPVSSGGLLSKMTMLLDKRNKNANETYNFKLRYLSAGQLVDSVTGASGIPCGDISFSVPATISEKKSLSLIGVVTNATTIPDGANVILVAQNYGDGFTGMRFAGTIS